MATYHGNDGVLKVGATAVAEIKQFQVQTSAKTADDTSMGDEWETHIQGKTIKSWTGSASGNYDPTDAQGQAVLVEGASVSVKFYPTGAADGSKYLEGTATVTQVSIDQNKDGAIPFSVNLQGNGALSRSVVAAG